MKKIKYYGCIHFLSLMFVVTVCFSADKGVSTSDLVPAFNEDQEKVFDALPLSTEENIEDSDLILLSDEEEASSILITAPPEKKSITSGIVHLPDGSLYSGELKYMVIREGMGTNKWPNGDRYQGEWLNDLPHGRGFMQRKGKEKYQGLFLFGRYSGLGDLITAQGERYLGTFRFNALNGLGILVTESDEYYLGEFSQNKRHGRLLYFSHLSAKPEYHLWFNDELDKIIEQEDLSEKKFISQMLQSFSKLGLKRLEERRKNTHYQIRGRVRKIVSSVKDTPEHAYGDLLINLLNLSN